MSHLQEQLAARPRLRQLIDAVGPSLDADGDPGHDLAHALRVARWTVAILEDELPGTDCVEEAVAAALFHDFVNLPKDSPDRRDASMLSALAARERLPSHGFSDSAVDRVASAVRTHSFSRGEEPEGPLGRALQDADRLEALGALGLFRTAACGARMGARFFSAIDPWAERRVLDDKSFSVDHFFTKLLALPRSMKTRRGRAEAERRADFLAAFLDQLGHELDAPDWRQRRSR